ncbi:MAG: hypothetical protein B7Z73_11785, partial [Planctomycetia bacterium 21-64-5]
MTDVLSCPDQATLQRLLAGQVPDELAADLEQHLLDCPHCCRRVRELSSSDAGEGARAARAALELSDEQAVIEVADRAATLRLPGGSTAFTDTVAAANEHTADGWDFRGVLGPPQAEGELGHFGGYRVLRVLGVGGMGLVWEAEDPQLRRRVALKVMKPALANQAEHRERFLREARAAAAIDQPANTWLEADGGWVKLVDFGLAHALEDDSHLTQTGTILGTPAYMSPEQARGEPVDARSDLFSLGAVLYRMTTGVGPFKGPSTMAVLMSLGLHHPDPPARVNPDISPEFSDLIVRLMAKDPAGRPRSAEAVVAAIREIEERSPKSQVPSPKSAAVAGSEPKRCPGGDGSRRRRSRWPWLVAAAGAAAVLLTGIVVIIRGKDGKILGTHTYPDGHSAEVTQTDSAVRPTQKSGAVDSVAPPAIIPEPPPLDKWLKGRKILMVSQDGKGEFKTVQAALDALNPGQAVEVLDRGPYRETLIAGAVANSGLISRVGTVIEPGGKRRLNWEKDSGDCHYFGGNGDFRLSGLAFVADALSHLPPSGPWIQFEVHGKRVIENCRFAGRRASTQELLVYWYPTAAPGSTCHIRECLFDTAMNVANSERAAQPVAVIERNWFRSTPQVMSLQVHGQFELAVLRNNIFDGAQPDALTFSQAGETKRLEVYNNTILPRIAAVDPLPTSGVVLRNNLLRGGLVATAAAGQGPATMEAKDWKIGNNQYAKKPDGTNQLPQTLADFVGQPTFLSREAGSVDYLRLAADSDEAHRGTGGVWPDYIGALPPGPAPKDGDWLTRWMKVTPIPARRDGGQEPVAKDDPDQSVVKWVRSLGGTIGGGNAELGYVIIKPDEKLPAGRFDLVTADLFKKQVSDADLARFDGLKYLTGLMLQGTAIGDRGIAKLGNLPELTGVYIGDTNVGDEGLRDLTRRFPKIEVLHA